MSAGAVVLRAERPADAAPVGAVVSLPRPSGQLVAPQQSGHLRHRTTHHQVIKPTHTTTRTGNSCRFLQSISAVRDLIREAVKMLVHMKALDHVISVAAEQGIKDIKQLLEI